MSLGSVVVRLVALSLPLASGFWFVRRLVVDGGKRHGELFTPDFYVSFLALALLGIPGVYVAVRGPLEDEEAVLNRRRGVRYCLYGLALLAAGLAANLAINLVGAATGLFVALWYGILGVGAVQVVIGLVAIGSGRDLVRETSRPGERRGPFGL